jgi:hypothetical protein
LSRAKKGKNGQNWEFLDFFWLSRVLGWRFLCVCCGFKLPVSLGVVVVVMVLVGEQFVLQ